MDGGCFRIQTVVSIGGESSLGNDAQREDAWGRDAQVETELVVISPAVIMLSFSDEGFDCPSTLVQDRVFGDEHSLASTMAELSRGKVLVSEEASVFASFAIPFHSKGKCDPEGWAKAADVAATRAGLNLAPYSHRVYMVPHVSGINRW